MTDALKCAAIDCPAEPPTPFCKHHWAMIPFKLRQAIRHFGDRPESEEYKAALKTGQDLVRRQEHRAEDAKIPVTEHHRKEGYARQRQVPAIDVVLRQMKRNGP